MKDAEEFKSERECSGSGTAKGYSMSKRWYKVPRLDSRRSKFEDSIIYGRETLRSKVRYLSDLDWEMLLSCGFGSDDGFLTTNLNNERFLRGESLVVGLKIKSLPLGEVELERC
jgi:hypothetical protein